MKVQKMISNRIVYICHPYRDKDINKIMENIQSSEEYARMVRAAGYYPIIPNSITPGLFGVIFNEEEVIVAYQHALMDTCSKMFVCGNRISAGMKVEIEYCEKNGIMIEYITKEKLPKPHAIS